MDLCFALLAALSSVLPSHGGEAQANEDGYTWFVVPLAVQDLPPSCDSVPVATWIDFSSLSQGSPTTGLADARSLRLMQLNGRGEERAVSVQFTPSPQSPTKTRKLLAETSTGVSFLSEYAAQESPPGLRVAGSLCWLANADPDGKASYRLEFGIPRAGSAVQVPYTPYNVVHFTDGGRSTPVGRFARMQIRPQQPLDGVTSIARPSVELGAPQHR